MKILVSEPFGKDLGVSVVIAYITTVPTVLTESSSCVCPSGQGYRCAWLSAWALRI